MLKEAAKADGAVCPTYRALGQKLGTSTSSAFHMMSRLEEAGLIVADRRKGHRSTWRVTPEGLRMVAPSKALDGWLVERDGEDGQRTWVLGSFFETEPTVSADCYSLPSLNPKWCHVRLTIKEI